MQRPNVTKAVWAGKFAVAPIALFLSILVLSSWWATQYVARSLGYQWRLGVPLLEAFGFRLYRPWQIFSWNYFYHYYATRIFAAGMLRIVIGVLVAICVAIVYAVWSARRARVATSHGTARFQTDQQVDRGPLSKDEGVILGLSRTGRYLRYAAEAHVIAVAPSRSGKGVGHVIPTLLTYPGSVVVNDVKGENWEKTAGYRARFSHVLYWNPSDPKSCHFNPLLEIRPGINEVKDTNNIVNILIDPHGTGKADFWEREATNFLVAAILHVLHFEADKTLAGVAYFLADPERSIHDTLKLMVQTDYGTPELTRFVRSSAQQVAQKYERELSGVVSTALSVLNVFRDPLLERLMADSDFRIEDLRTLERPVSLYLVVPPSDSRHLLPVLRLLWEQLIRRQLDKLENEKIRHKLLLMLDEFPRLGRLDVLGEAVDLTAGYGLQMYMLCQGATQVTEAWGPNHRFITNSAIRLYTTPNDNSTAREISEQLGPTTNVHQMRTFTGHRLSPWLGHVMISDQESQRPLMTIGEVLTMDRHDLLICPHAAHPIRARKLRYFEDREFTRRVLPPPALEDSRGWRLLRLKPRPSPWLQAGSAAPSGTPAAAVAAPGLAESRDIPQRSQRSPQVRATRNERTADGVVSIDRDDGEQDMEARLDVIAQETLRAESEDETHSVKVENRERELDPAKLNAAEEGAFHSRHRHFPPGAELER